MNNIHMQRDENYQNLGISIIPKQEYSTIENSVEINESSSNFDLYKGLIYMFLASIFKSIFSLLCKFQFQTIPNLSPFQLLTYVGFFTFLISIILLFVMINTKYTDSLLKMSKKDIIYISVRSIIAIISISLLTFSTHSASISDVYTVYYIYPAIVIAISYIYLNEKVKKLDFICFCASLAGVILVIRPNMLFHEEKKESKNKLIYFVVIISALMKAIADIIIRDVGNNVNCIINTFIYCFSSILIHPIQMMIDETNFVNLSLFDILICFITGFIYIISHVFVVLGIQNENISRVSMINYSQVPIMFILDIVFFEKNLNFYDVIGTKLIFSFNFTNGLIKSLQRKDKLNNIKLKENKK